jgi:nitrate reductase gamma subunit
MTDSDMRDYSSFGHFFNLALFIITISVGILTWLFVDPAFNMVRTFVANLISFNLAPIESPFFLIQMLLASLLIAYIPLTHMSHFFMKWFLYHDIRWGDEPTVDNPATQEKIAAVLNYPVTWAAPHIAGHGKNTWAEVAAFNPAAEPETKKE